MSEIGETPDWGFCCKGLFTLESCGCLKHHTKAPNLEFVKIVSLSTSSTAIKRLNDKESNGISQPVSPTSFY